MRLKWLADEENIRYIDLMSVNMALGVSIRSMGSQAFIWMANP